MSRIGDTEIGLIIPLGPLATQNGESARISPKMTGVFMRKDSDE